ncbi:MAG TPA: hypothetical protein H9863_07540, partial [Candidatus Odoribacter faecigallinarum]|nr:hypothetical protein [Candidatus Odoribacter faecigallinarum]
MISSTTAPRIHPTTRFYRFVGTPAIEETAPFPGRAREGAVLFAAGNKLYFGLGEHRRLSHAAEQLDDFWVFD